MDLALDNLKIIKIINYNHHQFDGNILKTCIKRNILSTDPNKKKLIYCNKFKTSNLVININTFPLIGVLQRKNVIYQFKYTLGDCISENNYINVSLITPTPSRRLTMHLSDTSSIAQHLKNILLQKLSFG